MYSRVYFCTLQSACIKNITVCRRDKLIQMQTSRIVSIISFFYLWSPLLGKLTNPKNFKDLTNNNWLLECSNYDRCSKKSDIFSMICRRLWPLEGQFTVFYSKSCPNPPQTSVESPLPNKRLENWWIQNILTMRLSNTTDASYINKK